MELSLFQIDAFASRPFEGNPAAVCPLDTWLPDALMQAIASENNLAETAFFVPTDTGYHIRWFTPTREVRLCGHATLASAWVLFNELGCSYPVIEFTSRGGELRVRQNDDWLEMDFPAQPPQPCDMPATILKAFTATPRTCLQAEDYLVVFDDENDVRNAEPDFAALKELDLRGVIITARSQEYDFVSRFFAPKFGINEDPVTGSAFTQLIPYWAGMLNTDTLLARQVSRRGGDVRCALSGDRVSISGKAVKFLTATISIPES